VLREHAGPSSHFAQRLIQVPGTPGQLQTEIFNEPGRQQVIQHLLAWLQRFQGPA